MVRQLSANDIEPYSDFLGRIKPEDLRLRFFASMAKVNDRLIDTLIHYDAAHAMAWIVIDEKKKKVLGVGRLHDDKTPESAEFAVLVDSEVKAHGIGWLLMERIIDHAKFKNIKIVHGQVLAENPSMLTMCREMGFQVKTDPDDPSVRIVMLAVPGTAKKTSNKLQRENS